MGDNAILKIIKSTVKSFIPEARVLVFGSRARGDFNKDSDFDILILTDETYPERVKITWETTIHKALVKVLRLPFDVVMQSEEELSYKKKIRGHYLYSAMQEAIEL